MTASARVTERTTGRGWALLAASLGFAVVQLDVSVVNVALQPIGARLGGGVTGLQWVVNAYTLAFAALILNAGALGDRLGAKRVFVAGFAIFTLASVGCALSTGLPMLIAARAVQGLGAAALVPCSLTLLNHAYPEPDARTHAIGLWAAGASVALSAGPLIGGVLTAAFGWRAIFFINVPVGLLGSWLTLRHAVETTRTARPLDLAGQLAAIVTLAALAGATIEGGTLGWDSLLVLTLAAVAVLAAVAFVTVEATSAHPMLPLGLFRRPAFAAATAIGLLVNIAFYGLIFVLSLYFQRQQGFSPLHTGLVFAPLTLAVLVANLAAGRVVRRIGVRRTVMTGAVLATVSCAALLVTGYPAVLGPFVVLGVGLGLLVPAITSAQLGSVDRTHSGVASGTLNTARQSGSVLGVALFGALIAGPRLVPGLHVALVISVALILAAALLAGRLPRTA